LMPWESKSVPTQYNNLAPVAEMRQGLLALQTCGVPIGVSRLETGSIRRSGLVLTFPLAWQSCCYVPPIQRSDIKIINNGKIIELNNGLIARRIQLAPNAATTSFKNLATNEQFIRSVRPEEWVILDDKAYHIGGLYGQKEHAYPLEELMWKLRFLRRDIPGW